MINKIKLEQDPLEYIIDDTHVKKIIFILGDKDDSDWLHDRLVEKLDEDLKFIPRSLIRGQYKTFPFHNIKGAKYLIGTIRDYNDINKSLLKSISGLDDQYDYISHSIISLNVHKIIIFFSKDPFDKSDKESNLIEFLSEDIAFLSRSIFIENGQVMKYNR